ncbi:MAG: crotonase/enoyl-CoA hydratase family protein [Pseudomonadota bacterium]
MDRLTCDIADGICKITLDDGKVNCLSPGMIGEINGALDAAEEAGAAVLLTGREGKFSAGYDLREFERSREAGIAMARAGGALALRVFAFPRPVVVASTGHAIAAGCFLMCAAHFRLATQGPFKIGANEVAIGMAVPRWSTELLRHRLSPRFLTDALLSSRLYSPDDALVAGYVDQVCEAEALLDAAMSKVRQLADLPADGFKETANRLRSSVHERASAGLLADYGT